MNQPMILLLVNWRDHLSANWVKYLIALVWIINGLFCKVLNLVPRHEQIVARILGGFSSRPLTVLIGVAEVGVAVWILSGMFRRINALIQLIAIGIMNVLEFIIAPDLLLWGRANAFFAFLFMVIIYYNQFHPNNNSDNKPICSPS